MYNFHVFACRRRLALFEDVSADTGSIEQSTSMSAVRAENHASTLLLRRVIIRCALLRSRLLYTDVSEKL